jgi:hypothetical protein
MCQDADGSFIEIVPQCAHLTPYGVTARYPAEISLDEDMVKTAITKAQQVYDLVIMHCPEVS